jgi:hypothetical protein
MGSTRFPRLQRFLAREPEETPKPKTYPSSSIGELKDPFSKRERNFKELASLRAMYMQGGPIHQMADCYPLFALANGYTLEGDDAEVKKVQDKYDQLDILSSFWQAILDGGVIIGDSYQEIVFGNGGKSGEIVALVPRPGEMFEIVTNDKGIKTGFQQFKDEKDKNPIQLSKDEILHFSPFHTGGSKYGTSIMAAAKDDIARDVQMISSLCDSIERMGHPRIHAAVGKEGEDIPQMVLDRVAQQIKDLNHKTNLSTSADVKLTVLNTSGVANAAEYNALSFNRLVCAMGVSLSILGQNEGSNRATAQVGMDSFILRLGTIHDRLERTYNVLNDMITGKPGAVKLKFNSITSDDENAKVDYVKKVMDIDPVSPIVGPGWCRQQLDIDEAEAELEDPSTEPIIDTKLPDNSAKEDVPEEVIQ